MRRLTPVALLFFLVTCWAAPRAWSAEPPHQEPPQAQPVNLVEITERLHTAGQPTPQQLDALASRGYRLVINLAPAEAAGAVADEGARLARAGIGYINIPVSQDHPDVGEFELFSAVLGSATDRKVLVHCLSNKRASLFTFLYRTVYAGIDPNDAWENVIAIWQPDKPWLELTQLVLQQHAIDFTPLPSE